MLTVSCNCSSDFFSDNGKSWMQHFKFYRFYKMGYGPNPNPGPGISKEWLEIVKCMGRWAWNIIRMTEKYQMHETLFLQYPENDCKLSNARDVGPGISKEWLEKAKCMGRWANVLITDSSSFPKLLKFLFFEYNKNNNYLFFSHLDAWQTFC